MIIFLPLQTWLIINCIIYCVCHPLKTIRFVLYLWYSGAVCYVLFSHLFYYLSQPSIPYVFDPPQPAPTPTDMLWPVAVGAILDLWCYLERRGFILMHVGFVVIAYGLSLILRSVL